MLLGQLCYTQHGHKNHVSKMDCLRFINFFQRAMQKIYRTLAPNRDLGDLVVHNSVLVRTTCLLFF